MRELTQEPRKEGPQGLKPLSFGLFFGTAEAVPSRLRENPHL